MTLKLIQAARLARFDHRNGWPETFTPEVLAQLQCGGAGIESRDWREALNRAINTDSIRSTPETVRICTKPARDVNPSPFELGWDRYPDAFTRNGVRYAYTVPAEFKDVTRHHITAQDFAAWMAAQGEEPSPHIAAWFKVRGVSAAQAGPEPAVEQVALPELVLPAPAGEQTDTERPEERQDRRLSRLRELGADFIPHGRGWRVSGERGMLARLEREERAAGRPMSDKSDIRKDLQAAAEREREGKPPSP